MVFQTIFHQKRNTMILSNHAPKRKDILSDDHLKISSQNALGLFSKKNITNQ